MFEEVKEQFAEVVAYSQEIANPKLDELFENWYKGKKRFIEAFGGKLVYEVPNVKFSLDKNSKQCEVDNYIDCLEIYTDYNEDLCNFVAENRDGFFSNEVINEYITKKEKIIPKGTKILKAFKYFDLDAQTLERLQILGSQVIQKDKISGTLCFSVHPLDYLSISENNYNWHSCHALDGEYRAGDLCYMQDDCTIICYVKGEKDEKIPFFPSSVPWNSKKWRVLFYVSPRNEIIFSGKQYPFSLEHGWDYAREYYISHFIPETDFQEWCKWTDPCIISVKDSYNKSYSLVDKFLSVRGRLTPLRNYIDDSPRTQQFNDVLYSSSYTPHYTVSRNFACESMPVRDKIWVGKPCKCLKCGKNYITSTELFVCDDCEYTGNDNIIQCCDFCGKAIKPGEYLLTTQSGKICSNCLSNKVFFCRRCGKIYLKSNKKFITSNEMILCEECYNKEKENGKRLDCEN